MPRIEIQELTGEKMEDAIYWLGQYAFHPSPPMIDKEDWLKYFRKRRFFKFFAVLEDGEPQSIAAYSRMRQNIRGKIYPTGGIWGVVTHPKARHKGYSHKVLEKLLHQMRSNGLIFTTLHPFRESFYARLGYATFPLARKAQINTHSLAPLLELDIPGEIELFQFAEAYETYWQFMQDYFKGVHGMALFDCGEHARAEMNTDWVALAKIDGEVQGLMVYRIIGEEVTNFTFEASCFYYLNSQARYFLLSWIARHIDQASKAELWLAPGELPETWLSDLKVDSRSMVRAPMGRLVDITGMEGMQVGSGSMTIRLNDPVCPWNEGVWRFVGENGELHIEEGNQPDCELNINALSSLIYGTQDPRDFEFRGWGDPPDDLQCHMRSLFPARLPYIHSYF